MAKLESIEDSSGQIIGYMFFCPGCKGHHALHIKPHKNDIGASWVFNGDRESPTFTPSVLSRISRPDGTKTMVCHSFVTNGKIQFLSDCTHVLAGQTVELPEVD